MPAPEPIPDLLKAVNEASGKAFALWITFLTVGTYLAIAIGTTTDLQLLLAGPVKLPLLGVDMPLFAFYGFAPPLFVVLHLYVLVQLYLLARLLRRFDGQLQRARLLEQDREAIRDQLDKFVFTQSLIGAPQYGIVRLFLRAVVWLSFVVGPVLLLLGFQLRFLPYHSIPVTYVHRVTLLFDLALLLFLWPKISRGWVKHADASHGWKTRCRMGVALSVSVLLIAFSALVATVPEEQADQLRLPDWGMRFFGVHREISAPAPPIKDQSPFLHSFWSDASFIARRVINQNISLPFERLVEQDKDRLGRLTVTVTLSERNLRQANFVGADLRKSDLRGANLNSAKLDRAKLSGANLSSADLSGADLNIADLSDADLSDANLSGADLSSADLSGADLNGADLDRADLRGGKLSGANLSTADLSWAKLSGSKLDGADLSGANLYDADLSGANLINTNLSEADLEVADLSGADLSGADLSGAQNLQQQQLDKACGTDAKLPPDLTLKPCPPK
jgi:uncharacterized protein YjbI with pentapeptide repeats